MELVFDGSFHLWGDPSGAAALVGDGEGLGVFPILLPQHQEAGFADFQRLLDFCPAHQTLSIGLKKKGDLIIRKTIVKLRHGSLRRGGEGTHCGVSSFEMKTI